MSKTLIFQFSDNFLHLLTLVIENSDKNLQFFHINSMNCKNFYFHSFHYQFTFTTISVNSLKSHSIFFHPFAFNYIFLMLLLLLHPHPLPQHFFFSSRLNFSTTKVTFHDRVAYVPKNRLWKGKLFFVAHASAHSEHKLNKS